MEPFLCQWCLLLAFASDSGCGKQFVLHSDLWLMSLALILGAVLPLVTGGDPGVLMACFLQKLLSPVTIPFLTLDSFHVQERDPKRSKTSPLFLLTEYVV